VFFFENRQQEKQIEEECAAQQKPDEDNSSWTLEESDLRQFYGHVDDDQRLISIDDVPRIGIDALNMDFHYYPLKFLYVPVIFPLPKEVSLTTLKMPTVLSAIREKTISTLSKEEESIVKNWFTDSTYIRDRGLSRKESLREYLPIVLHGFMNEDITRDAFGRIALCLELDRLEEVRLLQAVELRLKHLLHENRFFLKEFYSPIQLLKLNGKKLLQRLTKQATWYPMLRIGKPKSEGEMKETIFQPTTMTNDEKEINSEKKDTLTENTDDSVPEKTDSVTDVTDVTDDTDDAVIDVSLPNRWPDEIRLPIRGVKGGPGLEHQQIKCSFLIDGSEMKTDPATAFIKDSYVEVTMMIKGVYYQRQDNDKLPRGTFSKRQETFFYFFCCTLRIGTGVFKSVIQVQPAFNVASVTSQEFLSYVTKYRWASHGSHSLLPPVLWMIIFEYFRRGKPIREAQALDVPPSPPPSEKEQKEERRNLKRKQDFDRWLHGQERKKRRKRNVVVPRTRPLRRRPINRPIYPIIRQTLEEILE